MPKNDEEQIELINAAIQLFRDVDINSDGNMEWDEFIQYIMDTITNETLEPRVDYLSGQYQSIEQQMQTREATKFRPFHRSRDDKLQDRLKHHIKRIMHPLVCPHR